MRYIVSHLTRPTTRTWPPSGLRYETKCRIRVINENIQNMSSDALESKNHETDKTMKTSFWIEIMGFKSINQCNSGLYLDTLKSMIFETDTP